MSHPTIILNDMPNFDIATTLESGQCFRWIKIDENQYKGTAFNRTITVSQKGQTIYFDGCSKQDFHYIWMKYFDLYTDYEHIISKLSFDPLVKEAMVQARGLRIVQQQPFETLLSFIISGFLNSIWPC